MMKKKKKEQQQQQQQQQTAGSSVNNNNNSNDYYPYLTDFGISARTEVRGIGTLPFMAPEHWMMDHDVTFSSDLYSFGILMYTCFVGTTPFDNNNSNNNNKTKVKMENKQDYIYWKLNPPSDLYSVRRHKPQLPIGIDVVIDRLTRFQQKERYRTASEAIEELNQILFSKQKHVKEGKIFVSYARKDSPFVYQLSPELRRIGLDIWIDKDDIPPASNWDVTIENALKDCTKMLLIVSPASMNSNNVQDEWSYFLEEQKPVYPFVYQPCNLSFRLRRRQHIVSTGDFLNDVSRIVDFLAHHGEET